MFQPESVFSIGHRLFGLRLFRAALAAALLVVIVVTTVSSLAYADTSGETKFRRIKTQYIAALADPTSVSGGGAQSWGIWRIDPGPRGVWIKHFEKFFAADSGLPRKWEFDPGDWWLDENGLIMEQPDFPVPAGKYVVTGGRELTTILTIHKSDSNGDQKWELEDGTLHDVTHMPCRSARYTPLEISAGDGTQCLPSSAIKTDFPVSPGSIMPTVAGCHKQDYSVLIVIGVAVDS